MKAKLNSGDEVIIISSGKRGVVKELTSYVGSDDNVYLVTVDGIDKIYNESNLKLFRRLNNVMDLDIESLSMTFSLDDKIKDIINLLDLRYCPDTEELQLLNASKLQMYLATNKDYDDDTKDMVGNIIRKTEQYKNIVGGNTDSIINSYLFSEVLRRVGNNVLSVILKDESENYYVSNLVLIGDQYYYFDSTLETAVFIDNGADMNNFVLCCAALGSGSYEQFFTPLFLVDFNKKIMESTIPTIISKIDIDIDLVNKILNV